MTPVLYGSVARVRKGSWGAKWLFLTEDNEENKGCVLGPDRVQNLKGDIFAFVFCSICSRQNHSRNAVLEDRLMKID